MSRKKKKLRTIGRIILLAVISFLVGLKIYGWNAQTLAGNEMPMPFGWGISVVLSGSMEPELSVDDLVFVHEADSYNVDDIVVYQDKSLLIIHRIISIDGDEVITKGDANNTEDDPIKTSKIKGRAVCTIPGAGAVMRFLKTPAMTVLLIIAAVVLFEAPYFIERRRANEEQEKIKEEIRRLKGE